MGCLKRSTECVSKVLTIIEHYYLIVPINIVFCCFFIATDCSELAAYFRSERPLGIFRIIISIYGVIEFIVFIIFNILFVLIVKFAKHRNVDYRHPFVCILTTFLSLHHTFVTLWDGLFKDFAYQTVLYILSGLLSFHFSTTVCKWTKDYIDEEEAKKNAGKRDEEDEIDDDPTGLRRIERSIVQEVECARIRVEEK